MVVGEIGTEVEREGFKQRAVLADTHNTNLSRRNDNKLVAINCEDACSTDD